MSWTTTRRCSPTAGAPSPRPPRWAPTEFTTSLFPKDGGYLLPLKDKVRKAEGIEEGAVVQVRLTLDVGA